MNLALVERKKIESEIKEVCEEVFSFIPSLLENTKTSEGRAFYLKIKADFERYYAEASVNEGYKRRDII